MLNKCSFSTPESSVSFSPVQRQGTQFIAPHQGISLRLHEPLQSSTNKNPQSFSKKTATHKSPSETAQRRDLLKPGPALGLPAGAELSLTSVRWVPSCANEGRVHPQMRGKGKKPTRTRPHGSVLNFLLWRVCLVIAIFLRLASWIFQVGNSSWICFFFVFSSWKCMCANSP